ncbi:MAG: hypothetical protein M3323_12090 [Actinomycetota bacterium]|nr:hypothetical protein [Actinomycetota bacterium]
MDTSVISSSGGLGRDRRHMRQLRAGLLVLAASALLPGLWGTVWPRSFFDDFPGAGSAWVAAFPPYNEHLVRDVASFYLGYGVLLLGAAVVTRRRLVQVALIAWFVSSAPHSVFHLRHLDELPGAHALAQSVLLGLMTLLPLVLLVLSARMPWRTWSQTR